MRPFPFGLKFLDPSLQQSADDRGRIRNAKSKRSNLMQQGQDGGGALPGPAVAPTYRPKPRNEPPPINLSRAIEAALDRPNSGSMHLDQSITRALRRLDSFTNPDDVRLENLGRMRRDLLLKRSQMAEADEELGQIDAKLETINAEINQISGDEIGTAKR